MKKIISCFLVVAIFLSLFTMVTFAESDPPNIVANYHFESSTQDWYVFNGTSGLIHQDGYIGASNEGKGWVSPAKDIYDVIKEEGAGTYVINARIFIAFDPGHEVNARMMLRTDKEYSFSTNHNGNYYGDIGTLTYCEPHTWTNISGSVKILESDIQGASGDFILCFDSLFDLETYNVYVDSVTVCKLYEDDITNGDFSWNEVGWRNWGGKGNFTVEYGFDGILGSIFKAYYLKASPYGSIVTNVDQIIAKYGCTKYKLSFKIKVEEDYLENLEKIGFLFARNKGDYYNYWIGMADATTLEDGNWVTFEKTIDMATIIQDGQTLYDVLAPYQNQVFLRYHYFDAEGVSYDEEHSYYITDVSFKPVPQIDSIQLSETNKTVELGWRGAIGCTISGNVEANGYIRWTSSDPNIIEIDSETGRMIAKSVGNTNIFAISKENLVVYSVCNITVTGPQVFGELVKSNAIELSDIKKTNDGFYLSTISLYKILESKEIASKFEGYGGILTPMLDNYFLYAVKYGQEQYEYGIICYYNELNCAGVTVSFINFNTFYLDNILKIYTEDNAKNLYEHIYNVVIKEDIVYSEILQTYFSNPATKGAYLIAQEYIKHVVTENYKISLSGISAPNEYVYKLSRIEALNEELQSADLDSSYALECTLEKAYLSRVPEAVKQRNNIAGYNVYDYDNNVINVANPNNLSEHEKYVLFMTYTNNVTFNSFAAEIVYHAKRLEQFIIGDVLYNKLVRADMTATENYVNALDDPYYNENSIFVQEQIQYHGEC